MKNTRAVATSIHAVSPALKLLLGVDPSFNFSETLSSSNTRTFSVRLNNIDSKNFRLSVCSRVMFDIGARKGGTTCI